MTLIGAILRKVQSTESVSKKYSSPPPEQISFAIPKRKRVSGYARIPSIVDAHPPRLDARFIYRKVPHWARNLRTIYAENMQMVMKIKRQSFMQGRVNSYWNQLPPGSQQYYKNRVKFLERVQRNNLHLHKRILATGARVATVASLQHDWLLYRRDILRRGQAAFVPRENIEDPAFYAPVGVIRPRVYITLRMQGGASLGELQVELFTDVCPHTCQLFSELLAGDGLGHGYVGTNFFRKVPNLYWSGGDVIENNGFGCYAQRGLARPIRAENYHFSHSMPGLLSMRMTCDDEMCASFNITFKPLPQFDLKNVVFGRIVRPCITYDSIRALGSPLSSQPVIKISSARIRVEGRWMFGQPNTKIAKCGNKILRDILRISTRN